MNITFETPVNEYTSRQDCIMIFLSSCHLLYDMNLSQIFTLSIYFNVTRDDNSKEWQLISYIQFLKFW